MSDAISSDGQGATAIKAGDGASVSHDGSRRGVDLSGGQAGDVSYNDPAPWLAFFKSYLHDVDAHRQRRDEELAKALDVLEREFSAFAAQLYLLRLLSVASLLLAALALALSLL